MEVLLGTIAIILLACLLIMITLCNKVYGKNNQLIDELAELKSKAAKAENFNQDLMMIEKGDKVIYHNYGLVYNQGKDDEHNFKVTYELEVIEVTTDRVRCKAIDFTSLDKKGQDPGNKAGIINFMKDNWFDKKDVELVVDDSVRRNIKLRDLGI